MAAKMTRLPSFNDLKIGALAENRREVTKGRQGRTLFNSFPWKRCDGCNFLRRKTSSYIREKSRRFTKGKLNKRLHLWGLISLSFLFHFDGAKCDASARVVQVTECNKYGKYRSHEDIVDYRTNQSRLLFERIKSEDIVIKNKNAAK